MECNWAGGGSGAGDAGVGPAELGAGGEMRSSSSTAMYAARRAMYRKSLSAKKARVKTANATMMAARGTWPATDDVNSQITLAKAKSTPRIVPKTAPMRANSPRWRWQNVDASPRAAKTPLDARTAAIAAK